MGTHEHAPTVRVDEDGDGVPIRARGSRIVHFVESRLQLAERVHVHHVPEVDDERAGRVVGVDPLAVRSHYSETWNSGRREDGDEVDVGVRARAFHILIAVQGRVVDGAEQVRAILDPADEELGVAAEMDGHGSEHFGRESLERSMQIQHDTLELQNLAGEHVPDSALGIHDVPEAHAVLERVSHRLFGVGWRVAHLTPDLGELVVETFRLGHAGLKDLAHGLERVVDERVFDSVASDGHEAERSRVLADQVGDTLVLFGMSPELRHVQNRNSVHF
ncbi:MAG: hypothetical protein A2821_00585 [Candidatus Magasanikbacteria bacterium RIFCSPHIGHO2_01_FULL_41_23]|uniref:Uncharacterized protein n=1 Tax=Candidatus Magasanikbacteria bacterium RIFCSPLOWO2_01_FULL_40_15 TaxID=1798686 RepID=A0A1F6N0B9_9BACT|nr:MAG: hypothetical protein A2821_00585 [Candidatus Magasanikbacteria bacterium RIFCSPHIGHO2_01_FULL_41_23]OGH77387.1 MAG: hypothetical protein A2983_01640 [Candidatus Magasanikbacteria bacterium RIFCSPLOWO2_01_FULL_40_15]